MVDDLLTQLVQWHDSAEEASMDARQEAERDRDYRNGMQWTAEETAALNKRRQPVITIDRIGPKVDFLVGYEQQQRTDPKAYPRTPDDEEGAAAATDSIRYVLDSARWDRIRSQAFDALVVEGQCGVDVRVAERYGELCVEIEPIQWDRQFYDPHSRRQDFSDAKYVGQFIWMDYAEAVRRWPSAEDALASTLAHPSSQGDTYDDVPRLRWSDPKRKRVRIAECWYTDDGAVKYAKFTKAGILEQMDSPYVDEKGESQRGFVYGSTFVDRDGNRFGVVRRWISLQDEINKRRSKALHLLNVRQVKAERGAVDDVNKARAELARPDGYVEVAPGMQFDVLPTSDMAAAQFELLQEAKSEIDAVGVNAALSGQESRVMSGRALMAKSEQGMTELGPVMDAFRQWQLDVYEQVWLRIKQFWTSEKWVRVTNDERNVKFVGLNQPMTLGDQLLEELEQQGQQITPDMQQQAKMDPRLQVIVGTRNNVAEMDVDIILDVVPATASLQQEQFAELAGLAKAGIPIPPDALIEASQLRNKDAILEKMRGVDEHNPQMAQMTQAMQQMAEQLRELGQQLADKSIENQIKVRDSEIRAFDAETKRITALSSALTPELQTTPDISQ
jgi:hypothetical protein